jgi:hypothetical protein
LLAGQQKKGLPLVPLETRWAGQNFLSGTLFFSLDEILVTEQTQALAQRPIVAADLKEQSPSRIVVSALGLVSQTRIVS